MSLVFQYGSNTSSGRLNGVERLRGAAQVLGRARTRDRFALSFDVWSEQNRCAAANIRRSARGRPIWGALYDIPRELLGRETAPGGWRSLDAIEREGSNYRRAHVAVVGEDGSERTAVTYTVLRPRRGLRTGQAYVGHILDGLVEIAAPADYIAYVKRRIVRNNPGLAAWVRAYGNGQATHDLDDPLVPRGAHGSLGRGGGAR